MNVSNFKLSQRNKLLISQDYQFVFNDAKRFGNRAFTVLARENNLDHARLGLAISKKCAKRAIDRNLIKRIFRESFRQNQHKLACVDIIAMCKPDTLKLNSKEMRIQIDMQWHYLNKYFDSAHNNALARKNIRA